MAHEGAIPDVQQFEPFAAELRRLRLAAGMIRSDLDHLISGSRTSGATSKIERLRRRPSANEVATARARLNAPHLGDLYFDCLDPSTPDQNSEPPGPRVVAIGAVNVDLLASRTALGMLEPEVQVALREEFEPNTEAIVSRERITEHLARLDDVTGFSQSWGGSAFNTARALAALGTPAAFVGTAGSPRRIERPGLSLPEATSELRDRLLTHSRIWPEFGMEPGICVAFDHNEAQRSLSTWAGANELLANHLRAEVEQVAALVADEADVVHVTSLVGAEPTQAVAEFLEQLRDRESTAVVSVDSGYLWCAAQASQTNSARQKDVVRVLQQADILIVNGTELSELVDTIRLGPNLWFSDGPKIGPPPPESTAEAAGIVLDAVTAPNPERNTALVVVKRNDRTNWYVRSGGETEHGHTRVPQPLRETDIVQDVGAGDFFAAGFLHEIDASGSFADLTASLDDACQNGMRAAAVKLGHTTANALTVLRHMSSRVQ